MKSKFVALMLLMAVSVPLYATDAGSLIGRFRKEPGAEYVGMPRFVMMMATLFSGDPVARSVKSVQVLDMGDCSSAVKGRFFKAVSSLIDDGYEDYVRVRENGESVRILAKGNDTYIRDMLVICQDSSDCVLVRLTGKIRLDEMMEVAESHCDER